MAHLDEKGREVLDPTPIAVPLRFKRQSFVEHIQAAVRREMSLMAQNHELESFEDADDFDVGDEDWIRSPYEIDADQEFASLYPVEKDKEDKPDSTPQPAPLAKAAEPEGGAGGA